MESDSYLWLCKDHRLFLDATKLPESEKKDFYESIYNTDPIIKGDKKYLDYAGEKSVINTIVDKIPEQLGFYKNLEYKMVFWEFDKDDNSEGIEITDSGYRAGTLVKLH